ncbi:MAG: hypothetical protein E6I19_11100 [Chloroflexi bacterium]|nr:MAG: hypothetical protein E6I19_11100 [Chloroflexota bacterium]
MQTKDELRATLEVEAEMCLQLLIDLEVPDLHADARTVEGERELVLRNVHEHRQHGHERDQPRRQTHLF